MDENVAEGLTAPGDEVESFFATVMCGAHRGGTGTPALAHFLGHRVQPQIV